MSDLSTVLSVDVATITASAWDSRTGQVIPESSDLKLGNDRVLLDAVILYADLADSTELAIKNQQVASEVFKAYLRGVTKLIVANAGEVRSFDGDRVMGVFIGTRKNTAAVKCGLQVNWFFQNVLRAKFKSFYSETLSAYTFDQTVGIDSGVVHVARAGVRNSNDLIWVGRAPNIAAKLSSVRDTTYKTLISAGVYNVMLDEVKLGGEPKRSMWTLLNWGAGQGYGVPQIYGSGWTWAP